MKEFIVYVNGQVLDIKFSSSLSNSSEEAYYGFVNGIEVVSMPLNLYLPERDAPGLYGLHFVGQKDLFYVDYNFSMETCYRLNMAGNEIPPKQDTGMFRRWTRDDDYIVGASTGDWPFNFNFTLRYPPDVPPYTAPEMVYKTGRAMGLHENVSLLYNLSWIFPIDSGFLYLVRLHFCEVDRWMKRINQRVFDIFINNETAEFEADVIAWSSGYMAPVYRDYVVFVPKVNNGERQDLWLELHPNTKTNSQYYNVILNGAEIFKLSNYDGNLAGPNPPKKIVPSLPPKKLNPKSSKKITLIMIVDTSMKGTISKESFVKFLEIAMNCLAKHSVERPTMGEVLWNLELSLKLQTGVETGKVEVLNNMEFHIATTSTGNNSDATPGIEFSEIVMPLGR
ncbi:Receptor-like protein kinase FERONIA [Camellia lanceoleosa]|uniref:Receptor-like protein kinase FERONIA n=1 Tax=Camellia lanceoleosa TaxID=1840588 RepID=A0ACC0G9C5_9ERIC|nr:Receptor-like protein kinase FERONIA [Camellia lanceoleosa]